MIFCAIKFKYWTTPDSNEWFCFIEMLVAKVFPKGIFNILFSFKIIIKTVKITTFALFYEVQN